MTITPLNKGIITRIVISIFLAAAALGIFLINRRNFQTAQHSPDYVQDHLTKIAATTADIDREIDTVLSHFGVESDWIRKRQIPLPNISLQRTERRVAIPRDIPPVLISQALNNMVKKYHGRAIASENLKENSVTIQIETEGIITQTIILKPNTELRRGFRRIPPPRA
jgi:hypothetical protein